LKLILAGSSALVAYLVWQSRGWPLIHDAPIMHYVAWLIAQGAAPYRDVFDMNLPGAYLIHWAILAVGGAGDLAWRLFDLGWLAAVGGLLFAYCRPLGARAAAAAAVLFALYHLSGGAWRAGQRDFLLCLFLLLGAVGVARSLERGGALLPLLWAGVALGAGMTVKPQSGLFWVGCAAVAAWEGWRRGRSAPAAAGAVLGAGLAIPILVFGWLAWRGGLGPFVAILTTYVLPLYSHVGRVSVWEALGWYVYGWPLWAAFGALGVLAVLGSAPAGAEVRRRLALLGVAYGWLHFYLQGKGWEYHLYPLAFFLCALMPFAVARLPVHAPWTSALALRRSAALAGWAFLVVVLGAKGVDAIDAPWIAEKARRVAAISRDLAPLAPRGATVQVMDVTEGGVHALLRLGLREPTRFIYDFHFFHDVADPRIQALRAEFAARVDAGRPAAIVVLRDTWNRKGYDRLDELPGLTRMLERAYTLAVEGDGYRIYARRADS
jgi:dolichyl-phosphate-mannose-protein mannosyltransferase